MLPSRILNFWTVHAGSFNCRGAAQFGFVFSAVAPRFLVILQDAVGQAEASGCVSAVGAAMGDHNDREYRNGPGIEHLSRERVVVVLVDLKRRIKCDSFIIKEADIDPIRLHHGTKSRLCRDRVQADDRAGPRRLCGGSAPQAGK